MALIVKAVEKLVKFSKDELKSTTIQITCIIRNGNDLRGNFRVKRPYCVDFGIFLQEKYKKSGFPAYSCTYLIKI